MTTKPAITLEWVEEQEAHLRAKLEELAIMRRTLEGMHGSGGGKPISRPYKTARLHTGYGSKKKTLLGVIAEAGDRGLTIQEVVVAAKAKGLKDAKAESVSPKLSFYKSDKLLNLEENNRWTITDKGAGLLLPPEMT